jgi:hypothetical protein
MKVEIFKQTFENFNCVSHHEHNPIGGRHLNPLMDLDDLFGDGVIIHKTETPTKRHPLFLIKKTDTDEETYLKNYGNPMCTVTKTHAMVVVEKTGDKVAIKLFHGFRNRRAGNTWFKVSWNVQYISVNTKTGDVYTGYIREYQKKRKCKKRIRRNFFANDPISSMKSMIKNVINGYVLDKDKLSNVITDTISKFMFEIDSQDDFGQLDFSQRLFRFYLDKRQIRYPNNFQVFAQHLVGPEIRKILKKNGNKLVDAFMEVQKISGRKLKKALHNCHGLNISLYQHARDLFGDDWLNQDEGMIVSLLNSTSGPSSILPEFKNIISNEELKRVYSVFKKVYIDNTLDSWTFADHTRMYTELRLYGETDLRWMSENNKDEFRQEHLDWTDKIQFYRQGFYKRFYPQYFVDMIQNKIGEYVPVLLTNSNQYNEESSTQSNCVKTYIGKPSSFIISLRKGLYGERATIEYQLFKTGDKVEVKRIQSLGRFNYKLEEEWNDVLFKLDEIVVSSVKDKRFETVQITKECKNGIILNSDSDWDHGNKLRWTHKNIESVPKGMWDFL